MARPPLERLFPIVATARDYDRERARGDLVAGLTVGVMLVPQAMAYAVIAGVPPIYGLYASLVPLLVYPIWGSSRHLAVGPIAIDMLIVASGVAALGVGGSPGEVVSMALTLAALTGAIQLAMWALRMGFVASLLSRPVVTGFTSAAAVLIASSQLGNLLGLDLGRSASILGTLGNLGRSLGDITPWAAGMGGAGIAVMVGLKRFVPKAPRALVVMLLALGATWMMGLDDGRVEVVGAVPAGLPGWTPWVLDWPTIRALLPVALTLALVQFMDVISLGRAFAARHGYSLEPDRELLALGAMNLAGSLTSAIPTSGSFSRSAVAEGAGVYTPLANLPAAGVVALSLLVLTEVVALVPMPALAAIIIAATLGMLDPGSFRHLWRIQRREAAEALVTLAATLLIGIQEGILIGISASMLSLLYRVGRPRVTQLGRVPGTQSWRNIERFTGAQTFEGLLVLRVEAAFSFANAEYLKQAILGHPVVRAHEVRAVVLDASVVNDLDSTAAGALEGVIESLRDEGIELYISGMMGPVRDVLRRSGLGEHIDADHLWANVPEAVEFALAQAHGWTPEADEVPRTPFASPSEEE